MKRGCSSARHRILDKKPMAHRIKDKLATPPWLIGPGLIVPPIFLLLIITVLPRSVEPQLPIPVIDAMEADNYLKTVAARTAEIERTLDLRMLVEDWESLLEVERELDHEGTRQLVGRAQNRLRESCHKAALRGGRERPIRIGEKVALELTRAVVKLERGDQEALTDVRRLGGEFSDVMRDTRVLDRNLKLRVHPIVLYALVSKRWRSSCGIYAEPASIERDAFDVFRIRFGRELPLSSRLDSVDSFASRNPEYPAVRAKAAILSSSKRQKQLERLLLKAVRENPRDIALVNYFVFASGRD